MPARVLQVNVSNGGVPKRAVPEAFVGREGLTGDAVNHPKVHGGPERAVCLFPVELIQTLSSENLPSIFLVNNFVALSQIFQSHHNRI